MYDYTDIVIHNSACVVIHNNVADNGAKNGIQEIVETLVPSEHNPHNIVAKSLKPSLFMLNLYNFYAK